MATPEQKTRKKPSAYEVIRDTREKPGQGWVFSPTETCAGTVGLALPTGDYSLKGYESVLCIERKGSISEFAGNLMEARFVRELERMTKFSVAIVMLEFDYMDVMTWPQSSSMSKAQQANVRISRWFLQSKFWELQLRFPTIQFMFVGKWGKEAASCVFKRVIEKYEKSTA